MKALGFIFLILMIAKGMPVMSNPVNPAREVRTYMSYTWPIDPTKIITLPDMDLSYALASTLIEWGPDKQPVGGLVGEWKFVSDTIVSFTLRSGLNWSDGTPVTSEQVKKSFLRGMKTHPEDLRSLINLVDHFECPDSNIIDFHLKASSKDNNLLGKLTEANYGILNVREDGKLDLSKTTGPFFVAHGTQNELDLKPNPYYVHGGDTLAQSIKIKRMPVGRNPQDVLLEDSWPNLIQILSLMPNATTERYHSDGYEFWKRPVDRMFFLQLSPRLFSDAGMELFRFLYTHLNKESLVQGLSGYRLTDQIFPPGYQLYDPDFDAKKVQKTDLPSQFKTTPLEILYSPERVNPIFKANIEREITLITGVKPKFISIAMSDLVPQYRKAGFDFYIGTVGLADPDPEGLMSYYLENDVKVIPEIGASYLKRLDEARRQTDEIKRVAMMRSILTEGTLTGRVVPLCQLSLMGLARKGIDLSQIPTTDESVTLSKIRFKDAGK